MGGLAVAIRDWAGAFLCISHNVEFVSALCPERWHVEGGRLTHKGKVAIIEDAFEETAAKVESRESSRANTPTVSKGAARMAAKMASRTPGKGSAESTPKGSATNTPIGSGANTPAGSGDEAAGGQAANGVPKVAKKKLTRKQVKEREDRRRARTLAFLSSSVPGAVVSVFLFVLHRIF